jgi:hypothetical protein
MRLADLTTEADSVLVETAWLEANNLFNLSNNKRRKSRMKRKELSFHDDIKALGYLLRQCNELQGAILEIGIWKGRSLLFLNLLNTSGCPVIGLDPCEVKGQESELDYFHGELFPDSLIIKSHSENAFSKVLAISTKLKFIHIDGGHSANNVFTDFLLYSPLVCSGGVVVFDDYNDSEYSPEVGPAVDKLESLGLFSEFHLIGTIDEFPNSFILKKK